MKTLIKNARLFDNPELSHIVMNARFGGKQIKDLRAEVSSLSSKAEIIIDSLAVIIYDRQHEIKHYISLTTGEIETKKIGESWS